MDACPKGSWILDDESLGLDTSTCDGCGLCVPACTEGAITQTKDCTIREENQKKVLLLGCEYIDPNHESTHKSDSWKCIHAVSTSELLNFYHDGIHQIVVSKADCDTCSRGACEQLYERLNKVNRMLRHNHLAPFHYNELPVAQWHQLWKTPEKSVPGPEMSRRMFFRSAIKQTVDIVLHHSTLDSTQRKFVPLAKILNREEGAVDKTLYPAVPVINSEKCNGCDTCVRACPHGALHFKIEDSKARYDIEPQSCSACQICIDLCELNAISVLSWSTQTDPVICLNMEQCRACGIAFHYPIENEAPRKLCNICEKTNHQRNLFQVF